MSFHLKCIKRLVDSLPKREESLSTSPKPNCPNCRARIWLDKKGTCCPFEVWGDSRRIKADLSRSQQESNFESAGYQRWPELGQYNSRYPGLNSVERQRAQQLLFLETERQRIRSETERLDQQLWRIVVENRDNPRAIIAAVANSHDSSFTQGLRANFESDIEEYWESTYQQEE